jgi:hypothetical protein
MVKRWSLDARSRRRKPQDLCVGSEGRARGYLAQGKALISHRLIKRIQPGLAGSMEKYIGQTIQ